MQYLNGKRYYTMAQHCRERFGGRIVKIPLCSGFGCPNRDGSKGIGGCSFCSGAGGGEFSPRQHSPLAEQLKAARLPDKWQGCVKVAYFQSFSNTHTTAQGLSELLQETLLLPDIAAVRLATRADCIDEQRADILAEIAEKIPLGVELGLQTVHDQTARAINRCHTFKDFEQGYKLLKERKIYVCTHLINGLPNETPQMMLTSAKVLGALLPDAVKLHMLHIIKGSQIALNYAQKPFELLSLSEYVDIVCEQIRLLPPQTVIERLTGDGSRETLIAPLWTANKRNVLNLIDKQLARRDIWQGDSFGG